VSAIGVSGVVKEYPGGVLALNDVSLEIGDGEFVVLVGPSGCGKSTLLRIIAGLDQATRGTIEIGGRDITALPPGDRDIAMVFQNYALYPHMTVRENMRFGLEVRKTARDEIERRVVEAAGILGIEEYLHRKPRQLSGGQRQRVAMGRAIVRRPLAFLMDEPLSNLDAKLRVSMRAELAGLRERVPTTTVYVTHDQVEAMTLGDRVAIIRDGVLQQYGTPVDVFERPANVFVATFIGSPAMNVVQGRVHEGRVVAGEHFAVPLGEYAARRLEGREVIVGVRPADLLEDQRADPALPRIEVRCDVVEYLGTEANVLFTLDVPPVGDAAQVEDGDDPAAAGPRGRTRFAARLGRTSTARAGQPVRLAVDVERLYFFDVASRETLLTPSDLPPARADVSLSR
jgi:multiple sugar transport system ATP-binding protein